MWQVLPPEHAGKGSRSATTGVWGIGLAGLLVSSFAQASMSPQRSPLEVGQCSVYDAGVQVGTLQDPLLEEVSALAASHLNPGTFWTVTDTGGEAYLFAIQDTGELIELFWVSGATSIDWEDVAVGPCAESCSCLYIADIGDPAEGRDGGTVYRLPEPILGETHRVTAAATALHFQYPDEAHDAETLLVDPRNGSLYVVTKDDEGFNSVYRFPTLEPADADPDGSPGKITLEYVGEATFSTGGKRARWATGGSVAPDGGRLVVRSEEVVQEYAIPLGAPLEAAFYGTPTSIVVPYAPQGEGVTYGPDGTQLWLSSEFIPSPIHVLTCLEGQPGQALPVLSVACANAADSGPVYGCGCSTGPDVPRRFPWGVGGCLGVGVLAWRRRRRRVSARRR